MCVCVCVCVCVCLPTDTFSLKRHVRLYLIHKFQKLFAFIQMLDGTLNLTCKRTSLFLKKVCYDQDYT